MLGFRWSTRKHAHTDENEGEDTADAGAGVLPQEGLCDADDEAHRHASRKGRGSSRVEEKKRHTPDELGVESS